MYRTNILHIANWQNLERFQILEEKQKCRYEKGFSPSHSSEPLPWPPPPNQNQQKEGGKGRASSKKNTTMKHTNDGCHLTQHARTGLPPNWSVIHLHTHKATAKTWEATEIHLKSTKFSPKQMRAKNSSLGQKLCKFYVHTYH